MAADNGGPIPSSAPDGKSGSRLLMSGLALAPAGANVIMQLSRLPIGRAVVESTVESGSLYAHPVKRTRTTLAYIAIALWGTDDERLAMRREVNRQHRAVHSGADGPVSYDAFDPALQLWVAACMYRGVLDAVTFLHGASDDATRDELYRRCSRFATTLQVPESFWPADRAAFDDYWRDAMASVSMDDETRRYLYGVASLDFLPRPLGAVLGPLHRLVTAGFLPDRFRDEIGLKWSVRRATIFATMSRGASRFDKVVPDPLRSFPWNVVLWDTRRRIRTGRTVV